MILELNNTRIAVHQHSAESLHIPGTDYYLSAYTTLGDVAKAAGLKTYDHALPQQWIEAEYWNKGKETPRGVWSYDANSIFGEFVSLDEMLRRISAQITAQPVSAE